jgi:hypothetical protein
VVAEVSAGAIAGLRRALARPGLWRLSALSRCSSRLSLPPWLTVLCGSLLERWLEFVLSAETRQQGEV